MNPHEELTQAIASGFVGLCIALLIIGVMGLFVYVYSYRPWRDACLKRKLVRWQLDEESGTSKLVWTEDGTDAPNGEPAPHSTVAQP